MKMKLIFWGITTAFFVFYFGMLRFIWNAWVPFNAVTDVLALFIIAVVNLPLSVASGNWLYNVIK
jgi:hypothetical protein